MAEMPLALWLIITMCFALLVLATEMIRFGFFWNACREAAQHASQAPTFQTDTALGNSAVSTANVWARRAASSFNGLSLTGINVYILQVNVISNAVTKNAANQKLATAADTQNNIYDIQVELTGQIEPLVPAPASMFGSVPGLTAPFPTVVRSQYTAEIPQGLNQ